MGATSCVADNNENDALLLIQCTLFRPIGFTKKNRILLMWLRVFIVKTCTSYSMSSSFLSVKLTTFTTSHITLLESLENQSQMHKIKCFRLAARKEHLFLQLIFAFYFDGRIVLIM